MPFEWSPVSQEAVLRVFFGTLFPDLAGGYVEFRSLGLLGENESCFHASIAEAVNAAFEAAKNPVDANIYFGVCARSERKGDKSAVRLVHALWADLDAKDLSGGKPEALERLRRFHPEPTIIVDSGNGYHAYWQLRTPIAIDGPESVALVERYLKSLARSLGADTKAAELARILRVPGTLNLKNLSAALTVTIVEINPERQWEITDFPLEAVAGESAATATNTPGWISSALEGIGEGNRNDTFTKITGRLHQGGWTAAEIIALLLPHAERTHFPQAELKVLADGLCRRYPAGNPSKAGKPEPESRPLLVLQLGELLNRSSPDIEWQIQDILPVEGVGILAGPPGCGKTWMLADLAIELSRGGFWVGHFPTRQGPVLCIDEESPSGLLPVRYRKLLLAKGLSAESVDVHFCNGQGFSFSRSGDVARLREVLTRIKPSLVIVDSLIRVHSADENSASEMSEVFAVVKAFAREFHCAFLFADHMRKGKPGETALDQMVRGSTDKAAFVDTLLVLTKSEVGVVVEHAKSRFAEAVPGFVVTIEDPQPGTTSVKHVGDANALKQERLRSLADPIVDDALDGGDWVPRREIVDRGAKAGVANKAIDEILKERVKQGKLERDDRRPEGGKGNKLAFYRLPGGCEVIPFPSPPQSGEEVETRAGRRHPGDDSPSDDPVPGSLNTGETETRSDEVLVAEPTFFRDPVPGSPSISSRETEIGSGDGES
jgi:hypothetical protein